MVKGAPRANAVENPSPKPKGKGKGNGKVKKDYNKPSYEESPFTIPSTEGPAISQSQGRGANVDSMCAGSASNRSLFPRVTTHDKQLPILGTMWSSHQ